MKIKDELFKKLEEKQFTLTHHELLLFCKMSDKYSGWNSLETSEQKKIGTQLGYLGRAYFKEVKDGVHLVIAHRGTCFNEWGNILADVSIAAQKQPIILKSALEYQSCLLEEFMKHKNIESLTHTGFSLGGFIAGALTVNSKASAVTFDSPGIAYLSFDEKQKNSIKKGQIINYVTIPNIVNTCNEHLGEIRQLKMNPPLEYNHVARCKISLNLKELLHKQVITFMDEGKEQILNTLNSHNLDNIKHSVIKSEKSTFKKVASLCLLKGGDKRIQECFESHFALLMFTKKAKAYSA